MNIVKTLCVWRQVRQQDTYPANAERGAVTTMRNTLAFVFKGNISIADCMLLSSLL